MALEEAKYQLVLKDGNYEIREYQAYLLAEVRLMGAMEDVASQAFRPLFSYITGTNKSQTKIAMTAPVSQESGSEQIEMTTPVSQERDKEQWLISFMMPAHYTLESVPLPEDPRVNIRKVPSRQMAVIRYSGFWSESNYMKHKTQLEAWLNTQELLPVGEPILARFNAPMTPWFFRRNEVQIPVTALKKP